jgi:DNA-binding IclR family transcriptional regulator
MTSAEAFFVSRTLQAIEVLAFQPSSAPQVASALQVHPRTARRLLNRLVADGWATRSEGRRRTYAPSLRIVALAAQLAERDPLALAAAPVVGRLHEETGGVAHLLIPSYRSVLCLVHRAGGPDARPQLRELVPAHATAGGKVLLAFRDEWRESVLAGALERPTARTIAEPDELRAEAAAIRERGHAVEDEEFLAGIRGVAVPVRSAGGEVSAALALAGPAADFDHALMSGLAELLEARAAEIRRSLDAGSARG